MLSMDLLGPWDTTQRGSIPLLLRSWILAMVLPSHTEACNTISLELSIPALTLRPVFLTWDLETPKEPLDRIQRSVNLEGGIIYQSISLNSTQLKFNIFLNYVGNKSIVVLDVSDCINNKNITDIFLFISAVTGILKYHLHLLFRKFGNC